LWRLHELLLLLELLKLLLLLRRLTEPAHVFKSSKSASLW
jgi:hypothetical protein